MQAQKKAMPDGQLARVVYRSRSLLPKRQEDAAGDVTALLHTSRRNNALSGVTGVLLFDGTNFLQAIEGAIEEVETVFENIACDLRHEDIELIEFKPIVTREYRSLPMAYVEGLTADPDMLGHLRSALGALGTEGAVSAAE